VGLNVQLGLNGPNKRYNFSRQIELRHVIESRREKGKPPARANGPDAAKENSSISGSTGRGPTPFDPAGRIAGLPRVGAGNALGLLAGAGGAGGSSGS
jgi:hypothetical protein